ncbi:MAG TPA: extracellular solute-binding protein [Spirochaetales bacterium]|nr:extracellular solute-binding protein [Spirochaetales bacterium]HRY54645.1 extracellular solute-binding protein [Spirochaetia bacterium]
MMNRTRARLVALASLSLAAGGAWAQVSTAWAKKAALDAPDTAEQLYEAAKKEGKVVIYSMSSRSKDVKAGFEKLYPGVKVETYDMRNTEIFEKIERENAAGIKNADVIFVKDSDGTMANDFYARGVVHSYVPKDIGAKVDAQFKQPGFAIYLEMKLVFYNTEVYDKDPIDSWWDLTRPEWKGKIMLTNPQAAIETLGLFCSFVQNSAEMAADYKREFGQDLKLSPGVANAGYEFIKRLAANDLVITNSDQEVVDAIGAAGQKNPPIGIATSSKIRDKSKGLKLGSVTTLKPRSSTGNPAYLCMVEGGQHPNAAKLLIRYMAGEADGKADGYKPFDVEGSWPTRSDMVTKSKTPLSEMKLWAEDAKYNYPNTVKVTNFWLSLKKK